MGFVGGDEEGKKSLEDGETQILALDSDDDSPPPSGEKLKDGGVQFDDTLPLDSNSLFETELVEEGADLDGETQVLEDLDCIVHDFHGETQLLEDTDCMTDECEKEVAVDSDAEGTERTEVLLSDADGVSDDGTTSLKVNGFNGDREMGDRVTQSEKEPYVPPPCAFDKGGKDFVVDSDASTDEDCSPARHHVSSASPHVSATGSNPGSARKSFTSVRAESLRSSGLAAALSMTPKGTDVEPNPTLSNSGSEQKQDNAKVSNPGTDGIKKDDVLNSLSHRTPFIGIEMSERHQDHAAENCHRTKNARARKLFSESIPAGNVEIINKVDDPTEKSDSFKLLVSSNGTAGLSYVGSQEPGEQSQANALDIVDKFLSINDVEVSGEVRPGKDLGGKSPHISSAKGAQSLAKRSDLRSPVVKEGIFDWIDSHEDEGGGEFFSKRKDALLESKRRMRKSHTQPRKPKHAEFKITRDAVDKFGEKEEGTISQIGRKIIGLTHSDSRLILHGGDGVQFSKAKTKKNLLKELDEQSNAAVSGQPLEKTAIEGGSPSLYDVGIDTQLAAEAMEALVCGPSADHDLMDVHPVARNSTERSSRSATKNKARSKHVSVRKRSCSTSDSEETTRKPKQTKSTKFRKGLNPFRKHSKDSSTKSSGKESAVKANSNGEKRKHEEEHFTNRESPNGNECLSGKSSKSVERGKTRGNVDVTHIKKVDSSASNGHASIEKGLVQGHGTVTPIASRTRQSKTMNQLKKNRISYNQLPVEDSILGSKRKGSNFVSYPKGKRTRRNMSDDLNNAANLTGLPIATDAMAEVNAKSSAQQKQSKTDMGNYFVSLDTVKRKARSSNTPMPPSLLGPCMPSETDQMGSITVMNEEIPPENLTSPTSGVLTCAGQKYGVESARTLVEDARGNAGLEGSPKGKVQPSQSAFTTPSKDVHAVSPICAGDDRQKQSSKKGLSRSSLARELIRLDASEAVQAHLKDMRRRRDMASVSVLFSHHLGEDIIKQQRKILARLGVSTASSSWDATHFIADKFVRTRNMLEAVALGKPVVTHLWLESCGQASCFIDERNYILRDTKKEKEIGFSMPASLARACHSPLLQDKRVFITPNVKPGREVVTSLVKAVHGQAMERIGRSAMKDDKIPDNLLILSCEEDYTICVPLLEKGAEVYSSELLLNGIVIQKLEYERHRLFTDHVKRTRTTIWLRNEDGNQFHPVSRHT
ncbi:uncharacterized protein LOC131230327 isoform X2 [Magnolia sinica]|uniref:uncharacterized protein LOC131230327 isoform X2 n=1 Tax=Magnolia sinica TaxID=86752 RepID=UPI002658026B|nr:uncharacterized protein LOC131230327 isoform X2 [Magnolia sinica]